MGRAQDFTRIEEALKTAEERKDRRDTIWADSFRLGGGREGAAAMWWEKSRPGGRTAPAGRSDGLYGSQSIRQGAVST